MPHRTTYVFPRRFPDRGFELSQKLPWDHEQKHQNADRCLDHQPDCTAADGGVSAGDEFQAKKQLVAAFCEWVTDKKGRPTSRAVKGNLAGDHDDRLPLLPPEPSSDPATVPGFKDRGSDHRRVSPSRLSSGSSCAGSLFSGVTTLDGNLSKDASVISESTATTAAAQRTTESYYLQAAYARRLASHPLLAGDDDRPLNLPELSRLSSDPDAVSHRLWVSGCVAYSDKLSDGFYNIMGIDSSLWALCNEPEEGRKMPSTAALAAVDGACEASMEVVVVDTAGDSRLQELLGKARELQRATVPTNPLLLAQKLAKLVAICMGGTYREEEGELKNHWKSASKRLREFHNTIMVPIGHLSVGLCRHRAILFKKLADSVGLPCRIARGCKYCAADHCSSCLVKIEDAKPFSREYVVDLIGKPGSVQSPDSSINGCLLSWRLSPLSISHLKEFEWPSVDDASCNQHLSVGSEILPYSGKIQKGQKKRDDLLHANSGELLCSPSLLNDIETPVLFFNFSENNDLCAIQHPSKASAEGIASEDLDVVAIEFVYKWKLDGDNVVLKQSPTKETTISGQENITEAGSRVENQGRLPSRTIPRYLNLEPSLAMDWLEISWHELHIKEQIGAGTSKHWMFRTQLKHLCCWIFLDMENCWIISATTQSEMEFLVSNASGFNIIYFPKNSKHLKGLLNSTNQVLPIYRQFKHCMFSNVLV